MATTSRTVSFVSHLELQVDGGKVLPHSMVLGDVDNDGGNELVVGTTEGHLYVFRGHCSTPCCQLSGLGLVTCITVGNIMQEGKNAVVILNAEGTCYVYSFESRAENYAKLSNVEANKDCSGQVACLRHKQLLATNAKMALLGDVDGDGLQELVISHTDRMVSSYRWCRSSETLVALQEWKLRQSVGSITLHNRTDSGQPQIIASQPGCAYATLHPVWGLNSSSSTEDSEDEPDPHLSYNPMSSLSRSQNPAISCQIVGNICKGAEGEKGYFALCTLDGNIKLIEDDQILWSLQVDHQLFAMNKLDVLGNRKEEVILCAWDGLTYIVDHDRNVVRYHFEENVQAFCAGQYAIEDGENVVCLVYADFRNKLKLFYDIRLPCLRITDFLTEVESRPEIEELLEELGAKTDQDKAAVIRYCMYGIPSESSKSKCNGEVDKKATPEKTNGVATADR